jgi:hypothetical protein
MKTGHVEMASLERIFAKISALDTITILCQIFDAHNSIVYLDNRRYTVADLHDDFALRSLPASDIDIRFYGGPPGRGRWFSGTLLTLLLDHAAYCLSRQRSNKVSQAIQWLQQNNRQLA